MWRFVCVFIQRVLPAQFFLLILLYLTLIWHWRWSPDVTVPIKCIWICTVLYLLKHGGCVCSNYPPKSFFYSPHTRWGNIENGSEHNIVYSSLVTLTRRHLLLLQLCLYKVNIKMHRLSSWGPESDYFQHAQSKPVTGLTCVRLHVGPFHAYVTCVFTDTVTCC